jgi:glycosyltransferase involved in cell wall biosynthesis
MNQQHEKTSSVKIAWLHPSIIYGAYWKPVISKFSKRFPNTKFFTGRPWVDFDSKDPENSNFSVVGKARYVASKKVGTGYERAFIYATPLVAIPLLRYKPDLIFASAFSIWTVIAVLLKPFVDWKVVIIYDGSSSNSDFKDSVLRTTVRKIITQISDGVLANSKAAQCYFVDYLNTPENKVFQNTYLVPDISTLKREPVSSKTFPKPKEDSNHIISFLFVGQIIERKGIKTFFKALRILKDCGCVHFQVRIIGDGLQLSEYQSLAKIYEIDHLIDWMGWHSYSSLGYFFEVSDVFVFPSFEDCWGMAVLEAMAFGLPVLCSTGANVSEVIENGVNGFLFAPDDSESLAKSMKFLLDNPETVGKMSQASKQFISKLTSDSAAQGFAQVVESLMGTSIN